MTAVLIRDKKRITMFQPLIAAALCHLHSRLQCQLDSVMLQMQTCSIKNKLVVIQFILDRLAP
jgi:hypothetical protein